MGIKLLVEVYRKHIERRRSAEMFLAVALALGVEGRRRR